MSMVKRTERLWAWACVSVVAGVMLAPALSRADFSALSDSAELPGPKTLIDSEGLAFGEIRDPGVLQPDSVVFPGAPDGDFVVSLGDRRLLEVLAAPAGIGEIRILFDDPVAATGIEDLTAAQLTLIPYSDEFGTSIGSTTSAEPGGLFGSGVGAGDALIKSMKNHDSLGSLMKGNEVPNFHTPVPGAVALGAIGLGLVGLIIRRFS